MRLRRADPRADTTSYPGWNYNDTRNYGDLHHNWITSRTATSGATVESSFAYTYDVLGRVKGVTKTGALFNRYGLRNFWVLSTGGHEWANWRRYLHQTAQIMFPDCSAK